jgi:hypothetical protein
MIELRLRPQFTLAFRENFYKEAMGLIESQAGVKQANRLWSGRFPTAWSAA